MKKAYQNMRQFWLDAKNVENRRGVLEIGADKIVAAGVEMAVLDGAQTKHLLVATNSLGDSSFYFENNSPSGLGGFIGGHGNPALQETAAHMLAYAAKLTGQMQQSDAGAELLPPSAAGQVRFFAVSKTSLFQAEFAESDVRNTAHPFYPFFAYSQQVIGAFRAQQQTAPAAHA